MMLPTEDTDEKACRDKREEVNYRLPDIAVPAHYCVELIPHLEKSHSTFDGASTVDLEIQRATTELVLHSCALVINEARTRLESQDGKIHVPNDHQHDEDEHLLTLRFDEPLKSGVYVLYFEFTGAINEDSHGFAKTETTDADGKPAWLGMANAKPTFARQLFPCWDEPKFKATFKISIKHDPKYVVLGNMAIHHRSVTDSEDGKLWTHFETTPRISTYLVAFVMLTNYERISNSASTVNVWYRKEVSHTAKFLLESVEKLTAELERFMGEPHKVPKTDHVIVPNNPDLATGSWGLITYDELDISYVDMHAVWEGTEDTYNVGMVVRHVTRELSHQWIGNLVGPAWWDCLWVADGLARYLQYYISQRVFQAWRPIDFFVINILQGTVLSGNSCSACKPINACFIPRPTQNPPRFLIPEFYDAAAVFRMMSHCLTEEVFRDGLKKYVAKYQYGVATQDDFWQTMQSTLDAEVPHRKFDVKEVADSWINRAGYPLVTVERDYATGETVLRQERFTSVDDDDDDDDDDVTFEDNKRWIPINYTTQSQKDFTSTLPLIWLNPQQEDVTIADVDANDWIIVNLQQTGYYRVNYDLPNWKKIARYLNSEDYEKIHVLNRAQIIDDVCQLVVSKRLHPNVLLEVTNYLSRETDYVPWYPAFRALRFYEEYLKFPEGANILRPHILKLMNKLIESVGFEEHPEDDHLTKLKRVEALEWASDLGHPECRKIATAKLTAHIEDPETHAISPNLEPWIFNTGMREANEFVWNKLLDDYVKNPLHLTLTHLACSENPEFIGKLLRMTLRDDSPFSDVKTDVFSAVAYSGPSNVDVVIDFVVHNWSEIVLCIPDCNEIVDVIIGEITSWSQFDKVTKFLVAQGLTEVHKMDRTAEFLTKAEMYMLGIRKWMKKSKLAVNTTDDLHSAVSDVTSHMRNSMNVTEDSDK